MRVKCLKKYSNEKKVPKINVPDKYFSEYNCYRDKPSEEKLYPNDKEISLYENGRFVVYQVYDTCYFMAPILGLIDQGRGDYIKKKIVREYKEDPTKAIVRLRDEDGLPVDIIVDKTRFGYNNRPLWLIMLDKGEVVGFKLLFGKKVVDKKAFFLQFPNLKSKSSNLDEKDDNMTFLKYFLSRNKLVMGSTNGLDFAKIQKDHVMYFKKYDENYVYGIESINGEFKISIANFNKMSNLHAAELPGDKEKAKKS